MHHGIWREINVAISRWSKKKNTNDNNLKWYFPSAISESEHCEWTFRRIMDHLGLFTELKGWSDKEAREEPRRDIAEFHEKRGAWTQDEQEDYGDFIEKFLAARPDGVAFNAQGRECALLQFIRLMDSSLQNTPSYSC